MRMLVLFDLPTAEYEDRREYARFRKFLIQQGFLMLQESVYCKIMLNSTAVEAMSAQLRRNKPAKGLVQLLTVTEKQFGRMEFLCGEAQSTVIDTDERLVIL